MRRLETVFLFVLFVLAMMLPTGVACAGQVLAVGTEFANVFEQLPSGEYAGLGVEIIRELAQQNGDEVKFSIYPWARAQLMVENGEAQILIGPYKTVDRQAKFMFAKRAFYRDLMVLYIRKGSDFNWDGDYAKLQGSRLGVINGWVYGAQFEGMRATLKPVIANTLTNGINMLLAKRVDFLASNLRNTEAAAKALGVGKDLVTIAPLMDMQDGYLAYCKSAVCEQLRARYDEMYEQLRDSGVLKLIAYRLGVTQPP